MPAPTLISLCTKACIKNIASLTDVGDFEYWKIRPVLLRVTSPEQLHQIEIASPQICGEDAELWKAFIARDVLNWKTKNYVPKNPLKWYQVYKKYKKEQQREIELDSERLKEAMMGLKKEKESHVSKAVDSKYLPKLPRDRNMYSNDGGKPISLRKKATFAKPAPSSLSFSAGSKTKMTDGKSVLTRARREAKEISARKKLVNPMHTPRSSIAQVYKAPQAMVDEHRKSAMPPLRIYSTKKRTNREGVMQQSVTGSSLEERERRLRALTMSGSARRSDVVKETLVGSDSEDEDDIEDLFNQRITQDNPSPAKNAPTRQEPRTRFPDPKIHRPTLPKPPASRQPPPRTPAEPKPSDMISSLISKPKPAQPQREVQKSPTNSLKPLPAAQSSTLNRTSSPSPRRPFPKPIVAPRKRPEVDIFNRGPVTKKQRVT